jgi:hypothetical protein
MPLAAPLAEIERKLRSAAPMVVFATFSAVPVVVASVLSGAVPFAFGSVTTTVPPPVAEKALVAPVERIVPPSKRTVAPVLLESETAPAGVAAVPIAPLKSLVPPPWPETLTAVPEVSEIVPS